MFCKKIVNKIKHILLYYYFYLTTNFFTRNIVKTKHVTIILKTILEQVNIYFIGKKTQKQYKIYFFRDYETNVTKESVSKDEIQKDDI